MTSRAIAVCVIFVPNSKEEKKEIFYVRNYERF